MMPFVASLFIYIQTLSTDQQHSSGPSNNLLCKVAIYHRL